MNEALSHLLQPANVPAPAVASPEGVLCMDGADGATVGRELGSVPDTTQVLQAGDLEELYVHGYLRGTPWPPTACELHPSQRTTYTVETSLALARTPGNSDVEKCIWHPRTGAILHVWPGQEHKTALQTLNTGTDPDESFGDILRLIVLRGVGDGPGRVCTRPLLGGAAPGVSYGAQDTGATLRRVNLAIQLEARARLLPEGWSWMFNVTNELLHRMTGRHRW